MTILSTPISISNFSFFFFNDTATTEIYTLSLHDALPISVIPATSPHLAPQACSRRRLTADRKSTRLNSSHVAISYAVFCLKKKKTHYSNSSPNKKKKKQYYRTT